MLMTLWMIANGANRMIPVFDTTDQPEHDRFEYWRQVVSETFVPLRCEPLRGAHLPTFRGQVRALTLGNLKAAEVSATPHEVLRSPRLIADASDDFIKFGMQLSGTGRLMQDDRQALLRTGDFVVYDTARPYSITLGNSYRTLVLLIPRRLLAQDRVEQLTAEPIQGEQGMAAILRVCLLGLLAQFPAFGDADGLHLGEGILHMVKALVRERLGAATPPSSHRRVRLLHIQTVIEQRLAQPGLCTEMIATAVHMSPRTVQKLFQDQGTTVGDFIRDRRLDHCRQDLQDPALECQSIAMIAARWGLANPASFSRIFSARYGISPRQYRKQQP
jgi:AraC-like DNA-binding protein